MGHLEDLENLECLVKLEDKDHLELLECLVLKDLMDPEDLQAAGAHLEQLECREWKE